MRIAGQKRGETYPEAARAAAAAGLLRKIGFDNSIENVQYANDASRPVLRSNDGPALGVTITGYTKGNIILIGYSIAATDGFASGPAGTTVSVAPTVDVGAGPRTVNLSLMPPASAPPFNMAPYTWLTFVIPVPDDVTADPTIGLQITTSDPDPSLIEAYGALLMVAEIDASGAGFLQAPTTFLDPV